MILIIILSCAQDTETNSCTYGMDKEMLTNVDKEY